MLCVNKNYRVRQGTDGVRKCDPWKLMRDVGFCGAQVYFTNGASSSRIVCAAVMRAGIG